SHLLNPASIRNLAASHPFSSDMTEQRTLRFTFNNILLPDSTTNEMASHGWIRFRISQHPDNPQGQDILNSAAIYFDFNEPIITNQTSHQIGIDIMETPTSTQQDIQSPVHFQVYPNPATTSVYFDHQQSGATQLELLLFDVLGRLILQESINTPHHLLQRRDLDNGLYYYRIKMEQTIITEGKLIFH
ncbi:MAG: T9SS type A sorting domain-containing protein, partial [Bacteroidota bacterium]